MILDGTLVINLDQRSERLADIGTRLDAVNSLGKWQRLPAVSGVDLPGFGEAPWFRSGKRDMSWAGRAGCTLSHRSAILQAKQNGWSNVLILEDDATFDEQLDHVIQSIPDDGWDVCYLGYTDALEPYGAPTSVTETHNLIPVFGCYTTHAYILRGNVFDRLLEQLPDEHSIWPWISEHRAIDRWYSRHMTRDFRVTAVSPGVIGQITDFSDIGQRLGNDCRASEFFEPILGSLLDPQAFQAAARKRHLNFRIAGLGDKFRSLIKRTRGF
ncbi:MAG: glycosyltransferase family 25 protein [Akkermansiaceae bacterium]|jgi:glycosyl transferase, family 25|nr:glycosyltransferase family 25 protein [Akkermansiaceae bacterium]MDP4645970.1 glycosyltransferase family 25 protein [Akkermansiaceae bacterium]MDP4721838.1 glycosyltransferase family 25 protein [Akkermansiaceae bacterium]MDP4781180.1 glycosyltransferase family 25 protein [Akkermansiaceae bacterium]MDP4846528.1 glycosyltransferase family 25 protein [Akkermansiaceae bacterium]